MSLPTPFYTTIKRQFEYRIVDKIDTVDERFGKTIGEMILEYCVIPRTRKELCKLLGLVSSAVGKYTQLLIKQRKLKMTIQDSKTNSKQKYLAMNIL